MIFSNDSKKLKEKEVTRKCGQVYSGQGRSTQIERVVGSHGAGLHRGM